MGQEYLKEIVRAEIARGWIGCNRKCKYNPCHYEGQDCTFCYCPFYPCNDTRFGKELDRPKILGSHQLSSATETTQPESSGNLYAEFDI